MNTGSTITGSGTFIAEGLNRLQIGGSTIGFSMIGFSVGSLTSTFSSSMTLALSDNRSEGNAKLRFDDLLNQSSSEVELLSNVLFSPELLSSVLFMLEVLSSVSFILELLDNVAFISVQFSATNTNTAINFGMKMI